MISRDSLAHCLAALSSTDATQMSNHGRVFQYPHLMPISVVCTAFACIMSARKSASWPTDRLKKD
eukprot:2700022-Pyramimonas_sp.AAC.2